MSGWNGKIKSDLTLPFLNALTNALTQACSVGRDDEIRSRGSTVSNRYKLIHTRVSFLDSFFRGAFCG